MNAETPYNILELNKKPIDELYNLALWYKLDTTGMNKLAIVWAIIEAQRQMLHPGDYEPI